MISNPWVAKEMIMITMCSFSPLLKKLMCLLQVLNQLSLHRHQRRSLEKNLQVIDRRVTRSQKKLANPHSSSSQDTSETLIKLAKESLEVGKLLGMVVIDKEEAALGRITNGLRKERKALRNKLPDDPVQASE